MNPTRILLLTACFISACGAAASVAAAEGLEFDRDIRPILKAHCSHCHGEESELAGGLDVRLRRTMASGGDSGPAIVPGDADASLLIDRMTHGEMPPEDVEQRPDASELQTLRQWIQQGARVDAQEPESLPLGPWVSPAEKQFWSFQPIRRPDLPVVARSDQARQPVDLFLLARLEQQSRGFAEPASRETWLRRLSLDLTGLAPSPEQLDAYLADRRPGAAARQVDRLLSSPAFGERWGRHWLDVAGYSDSEGRINDPRRPHAWKYRDFVIRSFNRGLPYDQFVTWQLAGDELVAPPYPELPAEDVERLVATGFLRMAPDGSASGDKSAEDRNQVIADTMQIVGTSLLGMTVHCAQCHNHRYDPISQRDYYQLRAVFDPAFDWKQWKTPRQRLVSLYSEEDKRRAAEIEAQAKAIEAKRAKQQAAHIQRVLAQELQKLPEAVRADVQAALDTPAKKRTPDQKQLLAKHPSVNVTASSLYLYDRKASDSLKALAQQAADLRATKPQEEFVRALAEPESPQTESFVMIRGDPEQPGDAVQPTGLGVLGSPALDAESSELPTTGRRLAYARWLTSDQHPLTARVIVNRIWMHLFGRGIVDTPADFGLLGSRPSHPLLLDYLASELRDNGWNLKPLIRQLVLSSAYRQSSQAEPHPADPENRLLGRMPLRRLDAEAVRDLMLQSAGTLNRTAGGPVVPVMADRVGQFVIGIENLNAGRPGPVIPMKGEEYRRSIYVESRRSRPLAVLDTFDLPAMTPNCDCRDASTAAPQSLLMMNSDFALRIADVFSEAVAADAGDDSAKQLQLAWRRVYCKTLPQAAEAQLVERYDALTQAFVSRDAKKKKPADAQQAARRHALSTICQALLSSNRFLYIE